MFDWFKKEIPVVVEVPVEPVATHRASMPRTRIVGTFIPLQDFEGRMPNGELLGLYKKGKTYYLRDGNQLLATLCTQWEAEKRIIITSGD
jgi:hypothetical protein